MQWWHQKCHSVNVLQDGHWQHAENSSSKPGKLALSWMSVSTLANFTGSNHQYTFSGHTAVGNSTRHLSARGRYSIMFYHKVLKVLQNVVKQFTRECQSIYKPFVSDQTVITVLSEPNTVAHSAVVLTDFTWSPFQPWKLIYQDPESSSTTGKPVLPLGQVNVLAIYTESNHEYRRSDPTAVVHSTDWLDLNIIPPAEDALLRTRRLLITWHVNVPAIYTESNHEYRLSDPTTVVHSTDWLGLNIFPPAEDALSRTRRFMNTWKTGFAIKASECSGDLYWIKPWIETFWSNSNYSSIRSTDWLDLNIIPPAEDALPRTRRLLNSWKTGFAMKASQCFSHLYWIKPWTQTFWSNCSGT